MNRIIASTAFASLLLVLGCDEEADPNPDPTTPATQILIPLYIYPSSLWDDIATGNSQVAITAIINPASGPVFKIISRTHTQLLTPVQHLLNLITRQG